MVALFIKVHFKFSRICVKKLVAADSTCIQSTRIQWKSPKIERHSPSNTVIKCPSKTVINVFHYFAKFRQFHCREAPPFRHTLTCRKPIGLHVAAAVADLVNNARVTCKSVVKKTTDREISVGGSEERYLNLVIDFFPPKALFRKFGRRHCD